MGATYEATFKTEVANWQNARAPRSPARLIEEEIHDEHTNCFTADVFADKISEPKNMGDA